MNAKLLSAAKRCRLTALLTVALSWIANASAIAGPVVNIDDIEFWVGTGANHAGLALDWQGDATAENSLVWGYRWDGIAKGVDMLNAVVAADPRLYAKQGTISGLGFAVIGLGYDANNDGQFALDDDTFFDEQGFATSSPSDGAVSVDPGDWYAEGWFVSGFWHYGIASTSPFDGGTWGRSGGGISNRSLANGSWDSLAFTPTFSNQAFAQNPLAAEVSADADFDVDGNVDGRDFLAWQRGYGILTEALPENGDANGDGAVDSTDLAWWSEQYGTGSNLLAGPLSIPEPATGMLLILFIFLLPRLMHLDRRIVS